MPRVYYDRWAVRMNIRGWDDGSDFDEEFTRAAFAVLYDVLGPARVTGVRDLEMFWVTSSKKTSELLDLRYFPATKKITCRLMLTVSTRRRYLQDMERLTLAVLVGIEERLAKAKKTVDLARVRTAVTRGYAKLRR